MPTTTDTEAVLVGQKVPWDVYKTVMYKMKSETEARSNAKRIAFDAKSEYIRRAPCRMRAGGKEDPADSRKTTRARRGRSSRQPTAEAP